MQIIVNGAPFDAPEPCSVTDLLRRMALEGQRCAVELNGDIVSRSEWPNRAVATGDRVEVVRAIGGG
ncbi:MAG: thiamine biosynthesis protein ThiS [Xanthomonadaceae bacterium]|nr:thiamine biosynthesis protein ThiS [Xanthomonadaceae bacterium]